jgi:hypothetical protein
MIKVNTAAGYESILQRAMNAEVVCTRCNISQQRAYTTSIDPQFDV